MELFSQIFLVFYIHEPLLRMVEQGLEFVAFGCPQHLNARLPEIRNTLEERRGGEMASDMQDSPVFIDALDAFIDLPSKQSHFFRNGERGI